MEEDIWPVVREEANEKVGWFVDCVEGEDEQEDAQEEKEERCHLSAKFATGETKA